MGIGQTEPQQTQPPTDTEYGFRNQTATTDVLGDCIVVPEPAEDEKMC